MEKDNAESVNENETVAEGVKQMEENRKKAEEAERAHAQLKAAVETERNIGNLAAQMLPRLANMESDPCVIVGRAWRIADAMVAQGKRRMERILEK